MDIENQIITIRINNFNSEHFKSLGYSFKANDYIKIPAKHLPDGSGTKVDVVCNYCKKTFKKAWRRYLETKDDICCEDCKQLKMMNTSFVKYGNVCSLRNPEVEKKMFKTNLKKYGCDFPLQNKEIRDKCRKSTYENNKENVVGTSKNQKHICELLNGKLNFNIGSYFVDMLINDSIICEYDGSGHFLRVKFGNASMDECIKHDEEREKYLIDKGYKIIRFIHNGKKLPSDETIINIFNDCLSKLDSEKIIKINFDNL